MALDMRGRPPPPAVQAGGVAGTDAGSMRVEIVELGRQRGQGGRLAMERLRVVGLAVVRLAGALGFVLAL